MGRELVIDTPRVFAPLLEPSRYKGAHGGRGSGKSHHFAEAAVERCVLQPGCRILAGREVQKSLKESAKRLVEDKIKALQAPGFRILTDQIITPGGGVIVFQGLAEHSADSIKSYEGFDVFWMEEAHMLSQRSLEIVRPTLRKLNSELWFSWNPLRKTDPVDALLRGPNARELGAVVVEANWRDNPWFPKVLEDERRFDQAHNPDTYNHVWEGGYATVVKGAYYAESLNLAKRQGRICRLAPDPLLPIRTYHDIGGAGATSDAYTIWACQFVNREIRWLKYYETRGQTLAVHVNWMKENGFENALVILPHDGVEANNVTGKRYQDHWQDAGFKVKVVKNQGRGAAMMRVQAGRRLFPQMWFDDEGTSVGRETLGAYHELWDDKRDIGLGPDHDWSSHAADSFGMGCIDYEPPKIITPKRTVFTVQQDSAGQGWLGN